MKRFAFAIPGDLALPTGGYGYDRRVIAGCRADGWQVDHLQLAGDFPGPREESLQAAEAAFAKLPAEFPILVDGLAFGALPVDLLRRAGRRFVALVHHPLAMETGLPIREHERLQLSEREALAEARAIITSSPATARNLVADYGVAAERITVALPGIEPASRALGGNSPPLILSVGSLVPRKGYPVLVEALSRLTALDWRCRIIGAKDRDPQETGRIAEAIERHSLSARILLAGEASEQAIGDAYAASDIFVLPSFHEGYGIVLAEAQARGLPIVATTAGAIPETVPPSAGLLVPPGDTTALAEAIALLLQEPERRRAIAEGSWQAGMTLPRWSETAATIAKVMSNVVSM